jgi:hypothetical protein
MAFRTVLSVFAHDRPFTLIVEPWAEEFAIAVGDRCEVVALHPSAPPSFGAEVCRGGDLMVWVNEGGATYEFWRARVREFHTAVAIPEFRPAEERHAEPGAAADRGGM